MEKTNLPLVGTSLLFLLPCYAAFDTENYISFFCWSSLTCTSALVHITKKPYHIYGPGNVNPILYTMDVGCLSIVVLRLAIDGWYGGVLGMTMTSIGIFYSILFFYGGYLWNRFVYDKYLDMAIVSHTSTHMLTAFAGVGILYLRAFKKI